MRHVWMVATTLCVFSSLLMAQDEGGVLAGTVLDTMGVPLPDTAIIAANLDTLVLTRTVTDGAGRFSLTSLPAGTYNLQATPPGIPSTTYRGIRLGQSETRNYDFSFERNRESTDDEQADQTGDLAIYGTVMVPGMRAPLSGVGVRLTGPDASWMDLGRGTKEQTTSTSANGRFSFTDLAAGEYRIDPISPEDPERRGGGTRIELSDDDLPPDVELWLAPMSQISGRVLDPDGEPVAGACVSLSRAVWYLGRRILGGSDSEGDCTTDEDGVYRIAATPGQYYLRVRSLSGGARNRAAPQFYPGVLSPELAIPVTVHAGLDLGGMDISLSPEEVFRVRFHLPLPEYLPGIPEPLSAYLDDTLSALLGLDSDPGLTLTARFRPIGGPGSLVQRSESVDLEDLGNDTYVTPPLRPGEYEMLVDYDNGLQQAIGNRGIDVDWTQFDPIARLRITLTDEDLDLGTIPEVTKVSIPGRVIVRGRQGENIDFTRLPEFTFSDTDFSLGTGIQAIEFNADGTFSVNHVHPGLFSLSFEPQAMPEGWYVASATSGSQDILRDGLSVGGGFVSPIEIVLADDAGRIEGVARNSRNALVSDARIVLIPPTNLRGRLSHFPTAEANASGSFVVQGVPPGDYRLLALDVAGRRDFDPYWEDPEFLREYEFRGEPITVDPQTELLINSETIPLSN